MRALIEQNPMVYCADKLIPTEFSSLPSMGSHHCNANFHFQKTLLLDKPLRIEVANDVSRNGISKTYVSHSYLFTT